MQDKVIYFDGLCNLCSGIVQFILKRNKKANLYFSPLQGKSGQKICEIIKIQEENLISIVYVDKNKIYTKSDAALEIAKQMDYMWPFFYVLKIIPKFIRDYCYSMIAKNRYKWFGKKTECWIPTDDLKIRFLP